MKINILHLSDLHIDSKDWDQDHVVNKFLLDLEQILNENKPDLVIGTGDITKEGKSEQFLKFKVEVVEKIKKLFSLADSNFIFTPGNHDVHRDSLDFMCVQGIKTTETTTYVNKIIESIRVESDALRGLKNYNTFLDELDYGNTRIKYPLFTTHIHNVKDKKVGIAALNTAWASSENKEYGKLLLGQRQVEKAYEDIKDCDIKICAFHHPLNWLKEFDRRDVSFYIASNFDIVFTGHEHETIQYRNDYSTSSCLNIKAGCLYSHREYPNGYALLGIDFVKNEFNLQVRSYFEQRKSFAVAENVCEKGSISFPLRLGKLNSKDNQARSKTIDTIHQSLVPELNKSLVQAYDNKDLTFKEIFIKPTLCSKSERIVGLDKTLNIQGREFYQLENIIFDSQNYIIAGQKESGKSTLLKYILTESISGNLFSTVKIPVLIDFKKDLKKSTNLYFDAIKRFLKKYKEDPYNLETELDTGNLLLLIDDLDLKYPRKTKQLVKFLEMYPKTKVIISTEENLIDTLTADERTILPNFIKVYIHTFKKSHTRDLIRRVCDTPSAYEEEIILGRVIDGLNSCVIPRTPFMISVALSVYQNEKSYRPVNKASLIEKFIEIILGKHNIIETQLDLDYRGKEDILTHFVEYMISKNTFQIDLNEFETEMIIYLNKIGSDAKAVHVINYFLERKILAQEDGKIGFNLKCFFEFFAAKKMIDDSSFYANIVSENNYLYYTGEIEYYAGLKRNTVELLVGLNEKLQKFAYESSLDTVNLNSFNDLTIGASIVAGVEKNELLNTLREDRKDYEKRDKSFDESFSSATEADQIIEKKKDSTESGYKYIQTLMLFGNVLKHSELVKDENQKKALTRNFVSLISKTILNLLFASEKVKEQLSNSLDIDHNTNIINLVLPLCFSLYISEQFPSPNLKEHYRDIFLDPQSSHLEKLIALSLYSLLSPDKYVEDVRKLAEQLEYDSLTLEIVMAQLMCKHSLAKIPDSLELKTVDLLSELILKIQKFNGNKAQRGAAKEALKVRFKKFSLKTGNGKFLPPS
ncbi:MAG: metallophosphoesterase [Bdellovibrio sp.]